MGPKRPPGGSNLLGGPLKNPVDLNDDRRPTPHKLKRRVLWRPAHPERGRPGFFAGDLTDEALGMLIDTVFTVAQRSLKPFVTVAKTIRRCCESWPP